ncbi:MAG: Uma2 family endonuclease [Chloroflexota bacterium]|nr:Uma2 family endonuclease [Chloroflexota bacterium]
MAFIYRPIDPPSGAIVAEGVSEDAYLAVYAGNYYEWIEGTVIHLSPASLRHNDSLDFLKALLVVYMKLRPIGRVVASPFTMRMTAIRRDREPDIMVVMNAHRDRLHETYIDGAADICIEVVSPESVARDSDEKFTEYQKVGGREYWLFDMPNKQSRFYRLNAQGKFELQPLGANNDYRTPLLPDFVLPNELLWGNTVPDLDDTGQYIRHLLKE